MTQYVPEKKEARALAKKYGWKEEKESGDKTVIIFSRWTEINGHEQIDFYFTTGTVKTSLRHPKQKKTQLFRRHVDLELLEKIFINPRVHTDRGYKRRIH